MIGKRIVGNSGSFSNQAIRIMFLSLLFLLFLSLVSSVNAANFTTTNGNSTNIQSFINNQSTTDSDIILSTGNYTNIVNLNVSRTVTIRGNGQVNIISTGGGTLFNVTASNVKIINLNISRFQTAINSSASGTSISNCNITTSGHSIVFSGMDSRNILLEKNIIHSSLRGVSLFVPNFSVVGISFLNNNITGTGTHGVYLDAKSSNNTITFTNNNITGTLGVYLYANSSSNTITFTSNNITGTSRGVELSTSSSNNTITFISNNITGTANGVALLTSSSNNNTITFTSNNITGTGEYSVYLIASSSNNNAITFTSNSITGTSRAVHLSASRSNNNAITFSNNNITGTLGVYLDASISNNSILSFVGNNIKGNNYAMEIYSGENFSGLSLVNNKFISNGIGLGFWSNPDKGVTSIMTNIVVTGNTFTGAKIGISFNINNIGSIIHSNDVVVTYSRFEDNGGNYQLFMKGSGRIVADYNWWGSNNGPQPNLFSGVTINNYYVMSISTSVANLARSLNENIAINYKFVLNGTNNPGDTNKFSPFTVAIMFNNKLISNIDGRKVAQFNVLLTTIDNTITAILNKERYIVKYKASKIANKLVVSNIKPLYNKKNTIKVTARDKNGKLLNNKKVGLFINNKRVATTRTNKAGVATFKYTFKTRKTHKVQVKLIEDTTHSKSNSKALSLKPKDKTTTKLAKFSAKFKKKATLKATLKNHKNKAMDKKVVKFYANKKYLGKAKTNTKGLATLTKKVPVKGLVNFIAKYAGDNTFHKSDATRKIKVK